MIHKKHPGITFVMVLNFLFLLFLCYTLVSHYDTFAFATNYIHPLTGKDWETFLTLPDDKVSSQTLLLAVSSTKVIIEAANIAGCWYVVFGRKNDGKRQSIYPIKLKNYIVIFTLLALVNYAYLVALMQPIFAAHTPCIWMPLADSLLLPILFTTLVCYGEYKAGKAKSTD